jgi:2-polyprenyl-6-methoxyphenol hydroxylase-like FAD-dependent oxidoreductase
MEIAIIGAGIGGLSTALSLHQAGYRDIAIFEAAADIREVGVGINLPPHATRELTELGLAAEIAQRGVPTRELAYYDPDGKLIASEARGLEAGYRWPQYSIHRGVLQAILVDAVRARLGERALRLGQRVATITNEGCGARIAIMAAGDVHADVVVAADGIRSVCRDALRQTVTPIATNGWVMYRGAAKAPDFLGGRTMVIVGDDRQRCVVYPIGGGMLNWLLVRPAPSDRAQAQLGNWNARIAAADVAKLARGYRFDWLDLHALIASSADTYEYPMADIEPLPGWVFGRCALLGDAAHAMYPFGSNGASQAILDARVFAHSLATNDTVETALALYEAVRRPVASNVQLANRRQAGEVMSRVSALARSGARESAASELQSAESKYRRLAGFDVDELNHRASWSVDRNIHAG